MARVVFVGVLSETRNGVDRETLERLELIGFEVKKVSKEMDVESCSPKPYQLIVINHDIFTFNTL